MYVTKMVKSVLKTSYKYFDVYFEYIYLYKINNKVLKNC